MGKQNKSKKEKASGNIHQPKPMDPVLIKAFVRGREAGFKEGKAIGLQEGKINGIAEAMTNYHFWTEEIDQHVKGVGPATKQIIQDYFARRIKETIDKNKQIDQ